MKLILSVILWFTFASSAFSQWRLVAERDTHDQLPASFGNEGKPIKVGDSLPTDNKFRWLVADLTIPIQIEGKPTSGKAVALELNCGDGGEVYVDGRLQGRFDNDHPLLALLVENAQPNQTVHVAVQVFGSVQGGGKFDTAKLTILPVDRTQSAKIAIDATQEQGLVPNGLIGLSQGGGMVDYEDATAAKLKEGGFKWFRTDNILTTALKTDNNGKFTYDWTDFDKRVDFINKVGAQPILAASYMPQVLDAVPNGERQSAPRDYTAWEELCYQAAKHSLERGRRVPFWEVWNEANAGWIKPGPRDSGGEPFAKLYDQALGKHESDHEIVRRFEAYAKLYEATARGVRRADPSAQIGGPALASGPFENSERGHCQHGKGFARGLMLWCRQEQLPLDFVSWHEYFQSSEVVSDEAKAFRNYLREFPKLDRDVKNYFITEWNEAWWADRPHDHELGAAWCADGMIRAIIPQRIVKPCLFYAKQGDSSFRGDFGILMQGNRPKPVFNMARVFNSLRGNWLKVTGGDDDVCAVSAFDSDRKRLTVVLLNYRSHLPVQRQVQLTINRIPRSLVGGKWIETTIDALHSNIFTDIAHCELERTGGGQLTDSPFIYKRTLLPNSTTTLEFLEAVSKPTTGKLSF